MRVFRIDHGGGARVGVADGADAAEGELLAAGSDPLRVLTDRAYAEAHRSGERVPLTGPLLPPVAATCVRDFITFEQHTAGSLKSVTGAAEVPPIWYQIPGFYFTNPHAIIGSGAEVPMPPGSELLDFECEVGIVIGRDGYNLSVEQAAEHIAGLTIFNDWSARDLQRREMQLGLGPAKGKDTATTLGPVLVSVDELADAAADGFWDLRMTARVNGTEIGGDSLANMAWSFAELIAYASRGTWVRRGDVIGSGTCGGGCLAELWGWRGTTDPPPLAVGDVVELSVEGIGTISNRVVAGPESHPIPEARRRSWSAPS